MSISSCKQQEEQEQEQNNSKQSPFSRLGYTRLAAADYTRLAKSIRLPIIYSIWIPFGALRVSSVICMSTAHTTTTTGFQSELTLLEYLPIYILYVFELIVVALSTFI
jgi:hypothetical protein